MLFNANSAIVQLYHDEKNNYSQRAGDEISFVLDQHIYQQSTTNSNPSKIKT
jgi:hypothetical protein